jgi:hypothetical protein
VPTSALALAGARCGVVLGAALVPDAAAAAPGAAATAVPPMAMSRTANIRILTSAFGR